MQKISTTLLACAISITVAYAQKKADAPAFATTQPYGKVDKADLEMTSCVFEKDANAEVLFDQCEAYYDDQFNIVQERHKRIKIFNDNGKSEANIRIEYRSISNYEYISGFEAQTINLVNGKPEITKLDKKSLFTEHIDKYRSAYVFSLPNIKAGSIIEYRYRLTTQSISEFPSWSFQKKIPVRYSEFEAKVPEYFYYKTQSHVTHLYAINSSSTDSRSLGTGSDVLTFLINVNKKAMINVPSLPDEPYMSSTADNLQSLAFQLQTVRPIGGFVRNFSDTWAKVGSILADDEDFGSQFKRKLQNEEAIITKAKSLKTETEKIAYIFKEVQNTMKWDGVDRWYTNDGTSKAWEKKTGNSAEINLILYHLLNKANVTAFPMVVSTRDNGKVNPFFTYLSQFNRAVVYIPVDSTKQYILDATGKYNSYTETPDNLLNSTGLYIDKENKRFNTVFLTKPTPVQRVSIINADIKADGSMAGNLKISEFSYNRINSIKKYKTDGEEKFIDFLRDNNNSLKISGLKLENMEVDSLPLNESADFKLELTGSDANYIYFAPAQFIPLRNNPFLSENRMSDVDFGYRNNFAMVGLYKIPAGYKVDALPKNILVKMPDESIIFRRIIGQAEDGSINVRYAIDFKQSIYAKENYPDLFDFYKKLHELINEQVVLKKS
jgi:hypothetical protein